MHVAHAAARREVMMTGTTGGKVLSGTQASAGAAGAFDAAPAPRILVTGGCGFLGTQLVAALVGNPAAARRPARIAVADLRDPPAGQRAAGVEYAIADVRSERILELIRIHAIDTVVHLATIINPGPGMNRALMRSVDVDGTRNVLEACVAGRVRRIVVASSAAAYGFHADHPERITEDQPLRGNPEVVHADHRRMVEEMLGEYRVSHPELAQVVLRIAPVLGERASNRVTALFEGPVVLAVRGATGPFMFVLDQDVIGVIVHAIATNASGVYNVAGDGALTLQEIAKRLGKPCIAVPDWALRATLALFKVLGLVRYGAEQVDVLRNRPALDNRRMKDELGYSPKFTSAQAFDLYCRARGSQ